MNKKLYHYKDGIKIIGPNLSMSGSYSGLWGNCSGLRGDCSWLWGDCSRLRLDLDDCEISNVNREVGIDIENFRINL